MKKVRKKKMYIVICGFIVLIGTLMIWLNISYSPAKKQFQNDVSELMTDNQLSVDHEVFKEEGFSNLPVAIQKYVANCGYIGTSKMSYLKMEYQNVDFLQGRNGPALTINYTQYNFVKKPSRLAFIDSSMLGIPFEGYDYYQNGKGGMKGVIGKIITLFDQTGADMDKACLVTFLAESLFAPSILLQDYISFEELSDFEVKATINYKKQTASGIFTFNKQYEMISFTTNDRAVTGTNGSIEYIPWSAICSDYQVFENSIKYPTKFQAVWNYSDEDFTYFDGNISKITYGYSNGDND